MKEPSSVPSPTGGVSTLVQQRVPVMPETVLTVRQATDVLISPDGQHAAFVVAEWFIAQAKIRDWDMRYLGQPPVSPLTHPAVYRERSPISYAQQVTTPTLIVHGEQDACVPVSQAYAFYRALAERGVPTELVIYPREGHSLSERQHLQDYSQRLLGWFQGYL